MQSKNLNIQYNIKIKKIHVINYLTFFGIQKLISNTFISTKEILR